MSDLHSHVAKGVKRDIFSQHNRVMRQSLQSLNLKSSVSSYPAHDLEEVYPNEQELDLVDCLKACIRQFNDSDSLSAITRSGKAQTQVPMVNMHEH